MKSKIITKISLFTNPKHFDNLIAHLFLIGITSFEEKDSSIELYVKPEESAAIIKSVSTNFSGNNLDILVEEIENRNWNEEWQKSIEPIIISNKLVVYPTWKKDEVKKYNGYIKIQIDPKMAFGTGHNETTQLVLELMLKYLTKKDKYLFDFGCGTGILAIAGIKMGIQKSVADDIDEDSIDNAVENLKLNKVSNKIKLYQNSISDIKEKNFDVICANIISSVIKENLQQMYSKLKPKGKLFISGVLRDEERSLKTHLKRKGFKVIEVIRKSEWIGVYAVKDNC
ncbi:MAG: 50S ribosomal protein L11 methyltransferase [Ignavibacteria bacterium]